MNELKELIDALPAEFNFSEASLCYNPMELFINISQKENTHSKIIADLLNPNGEHRLGYGFLINFLQQIGIVIGQKSTLDEKSAITEVNITTEHYAPAKVGGNDECRGRIDIFVRLTCNGKKYALIIENKLNDAPDMDKQLLRYNEYVRANYDESERITVYIPRIGKECSRYKDAKVINSSGLADIIDETLRKSNSIHKPAIQAYSNYLRNIGKYNRIMDNAELLAKMTNDDIQKARVIKEAYEKLPEAFAELLRRDYENKGYKTKLCWKYPHYCYIWTDGMFDKTSLWLAVGFCHDSFCIYIMSDSSEKYLEYVDKLNITKSSTDAAGTWFKPDIEFTSPFHSWKEDSEKLKCQVDRWLDRLVEISL